VIIPPEFSRRIQGRSGGWRCRLLVDWHRGQQAPRVIRNSIQAITAFYSLREELLTIRRRVRGA